MGPTSRLPLAAGASTGKALGEVADRQAVHDPPRRRNCSKRMKNEAAPGELGMRDGELPRLEAASAPQHEIEVEDAWTPSAATTPSKIPFDRLELTEHRRRLERTFHERDCIGEIAAGATVCGIEDDRGGVEELELLVKASNGGFDDRCRPPMLAVRAVRANCNCIEVRCLRHRRSPRSGQ